MAGFGASTVEIEHLTQFSKLLLPFAPPSALENVQILPTFPMTGKTD
jgi:hypothetical protein